MLRWKREPKRISLRALDANFQRGSDLLEDGIRFAQVTHHPGYGWYWQAGWNSGVPHKSTIGSYTTQDKAKAEAVAYVKLHLGR